MKFVYVKNRYYKCFVCLLFLTAFVFSSRLNFAQTTVTIGSGTESNLTLPVNKYYSYSYSQQIMLQNEIGISGNITKIRFYMVGGVDLSASNQWTIYLGHTAKSVFANNTDWESLANLTQVYNGTIDGIPAAGWYEIALDSSFSYNNTANLVVAAYEGSPGYDNNLYYTRTWITPVGSRAICFRSDDTNPNPASPPAGIRLDYINQMQFEIACSTASIPYSLDFESAVVPGLPECTSVENAGTGNNWETIDNPGYGFNTKVLYCPYSEFEAANSWFYTQGILLEAGTEYRLAFNYAAGNELFSEKLKVSYGSSPVSSNMSSNIVDLSSISNLNPDISITDFTPSVSGIYYIGFNCYSEANQVGLYIDNILLDLKPTCEDPSNLVANNITTTSASLNWTASLSAPADGYDIYYGIAETTPTETAIPSESVLAGVTTYEVNGLALNTTYYCWVRANCGGTDFSAWSEPSNFTTQCEATSIPYSQNFESSIVPELPGCTSLENAGDGNNWKTDDPYAHGFYTKVISYLYDDLEAANTWFYTQGIELEAGTLYRLNFKYGGSGFTEKLKVAYGTSATHTAMTIEIVDYPSITDETPNISTSYFTPNVSGIYYLGFNCYSEADQNKLFVDDILLDISPSCIEPSDLFADNFTTTSAKIHWNAPISAPANGYDIYYSTSADAPMDTTNPSASVLAGVTTYELYGLTLNTTYYCSVRSNCNETDLSVWTVPISFTTPCEATNIPYFQDFESAVVPALPECTSFENAGTGNNWKTDENPGFGFDSKALYYIYSISHDANAWFFTQGIELEAGTLYRLNFKYGGSGFTEKLKVAYGTSTTHTAMTNDIVDYPSVTGDTPNMSTTYFTPSLSGIYYLGFNCYSEFDQNEFYIDDIKLEPISYETDFITYSFSEETGAANVDYVNHTIDIEVGNGTDVTSLVADFTLSDYAAVDISGAAQESGLTANDFSSSLTYTVTAEDSITTQNWLITVTVADIYTETNILSYTFPEATSVAEIDNAEKTVNINIAWNADVTALKAEFALSYGAIAEISTTNQESGITVNDFTSPVIYTVIAEDTTITANWTVNVTVDDIPQGGTCEDPIYYGMINDPVVNASLETPYQSVWYSVTLDRTYANVKFSLCGANFDTRIAVFADCADFSQPYGTPIDNNPNGNIVYNDDGCGDLASVIEKPSLAAGIYYVVVYAYDEYHGNYPLEITGEDYMGSYVDNTTLSLSPEILYVASGTDANALLEVEYPETVSANMPADILTDALIDLSDLTAGAIVELLNNGTSLGTYAVIGGETVWASEAFTNVIRVPASLTAGGNISWDVVISDLAIGTYNVNTTLYLGLDADLTTKTNMTEAATDTMQIIVAELSEVNEIDINSDVQNVSVCEGTDESTAIANLAPAITITDINDAQYAVALTWTIASFDGNIADDYTATGTFVLPTVVIQTDPLTPLEVTATVTVNALPELTCPADFTITEQGIVALSGATPIGGTYSGVGVTEDAFDPSSLDNGSYTVVYEYIDATTGCFNSCEFIITINITTGIDENEIAKIGIYPNPNNGMFTISFANISGKANYQIYDAKGSIVLNKLIHTSGNTTEDVSLNLVSGIYFIKVVTANQTIVEKLVIQ